ncbi:hypothetical protein Q5X48_14765 [Acinetobacter baumannii]|nr:hypothetical protein [Acinetobacter baumannii]
MKNIKGFFVMISLLTPMTSYAGIADTLRDLRNTLGQVTDATKQVSGLSQDLKGATGQKQQTVLSSNLIAGQTVHPKVNNVLLYQSSDKSSIVIHKLSKSTDLVFSGNAQQGFYEVVTDYGTGWVEGHLVQ